MPDVLITGASGFTGTALANRLAKEGSCRLFAISRRPPVDPALFTKTFELDLDKPSSAHDVLSEIRPQWIFHLAGKLKGDLNELFQANVTNTIHILEAALRLTPNARILLVGSAAEYGIPSNDEPISEIAACKPETAYGISKYAMTMLGLHYASARNMQINVARAFNLIGPGIPPTLLLGAVIQRAKNAVAAGSDTINVGDLNPERDFVDVRDAAEAYLTIMRSGASGEVFNVCSGLSVKIQTLVETALSAIATNLRYKIDPKLGSGGASRVIGDPTRIQELGYAPRYSFLDSVTDSCRAEL